MEVEQLLSLSGSALAQAVSSLLETPGLYVFSDILELPNVKEVNTLSLSSALALFTPGIKMCFCGRLVLHLIHLHWAGSVAHCLALLSLSKKA